MKEVFAVDFDDCVIPFDAPFRAWIQTETGITLHTDDVVPGKFHYDEAYPDCGLLKEDFAQLIDNYITNASADVPPGEGTVEALEQLSEVFELHIVTARPHQHLEVTRQSVYQHFGEHIFNGIHTAEFNGDHSTTSKVTIYKKIGAIATVDDADHNINAAIKAGMIGISLQHPDHHHNGHTLPPTAITVSSLSEILQHLDVIKQRASFFNGK